MEKRAQSEHRHTSAEERQEKRSWHASQCVDLAVVTQEAQGLRARPGREGVCGEARVHQGHVRRELGVGQVRVVGPDLESRQLALVHNGARGERADVEALALLGEQVARALPAEGDEKKTRA